MNLPRFNLVAVTRHTYAVAETTSLNPCSLEAATTHAFHTLRLVSRPTTAPLATRLLGYLARGEAVPLSIDHLMVEIVKSETKAP